MVVSLGARPGWRICPMGEASAHTEAHNKRAPLETPAPGPCSRGDHGPLLAPSLGGPVPARHCPGPLSLWE